MNFEFKCRKCGKTQEVNCEARTIICNNCKTRYNSTKDAKGLVKIKNQLYRLYPKKRMSKKERLKLRRLNNENKTV